MVNNTKWKDKSFEERMTVYIDDIYKSIFKSKLSSITRSSRDNNSDKKLLFMDMELAIDTHLKMVDGSILTFQEKTRRATAFKAAESFTFEYYNDPATKQEGEWFKLAAQFYFYGVANANNDGYSKYCILNVAKLRTALLYKFTLQQMESMFLHVNKPPAKASFFAIPFSIIKQFNNGVVAFNSGI